MTVVVGLTGGIGCGKSTVAHMLEALGATVIDADAIVHELQAPGMPLVDEIAQAFGPGVLDRAGALDRKALGAIVFRDEAARQRLNALVHPQVGAEFLRRVAAAREAKASLLVLDIPLLFEGRRAGSAGASAMQLDATVLVACSEETQVVRQQRRDGASREEALARIRAQMPMDEKRALADYVIENDGTLAETERQVREVVQALTGRAGREGD